MRAAALAAPPSTGQAPALSAVGATSNVNGVEGMEGTLDGAIGRHPAKGNKRAVVDGTERVRGVRRWAPPFGYKGGMGVVVWAIGRSYCLRRVSPLSSFLARRVGEWRNEQSRAHKREPNTMYSVSAPLDRTRSLVWCSGSVPALTCIHGTQRFWEEYTAVRSRRKLGHHECRRGRLRAQYCEWAILLCRAPGVPSPTSR